MNIFKKAFYKLVKNSKINNYKNNYDYRRFGSRKTNQPIPLNHVIKNVIKKILASIGIYKRKDSVIDNLDNLYKLYNKLEDNESKELLIKILAYRTLGHKKVKLPLNNSEYWTTFQQLDKMTEDAESINLGFMDWKAYKINLKDFGYPIELFITVSGIMAQMLLEQYKYHSDEAVIEVNEGDIVIDAGAYDGSTALNFAYKTGNSGHIYSFEFFPDSIAHFSRNLDLNPDLAERITIVPNALWSSSNKKLFIIGKGPGTRVVTSTSDVSAEEIETLKIDDLVVNKKLARIDFIKMDVEGSELEALKGAEKSIRTYKPKLAISLYHKLHDFWEIPEWIDNLNLGYHFYLNHYTIHREETVLFAECKKLK